METTFGLQLRGILLNESFLVPKSARTKRLPFQSGNWIVDLVPKYRWLPVPTCAERGETLPDPDTPSKYLDFGNFDYSG
jgi:hypothetical protein